MPLSSTLRAGAACLSYITISAGLINFNKYIVSPGRFPHAMCLTCLHMLSSFILSLLLYLVRPSMYLGMQNCKDNFRSMFKRLIPIGCLFAITLFTGNKALTLCTVPFLQFMKETNIVIVFIFSCLVGLQQMSLMRIFVIGWVITGSALCVTGQVGFVYVGFIFQVISQLADCLRAVLAEILLKSEEFKLDPFSYTLLVSPICFTVLIIGTIVTWSPDIPSDFGKTWSLLIPNTCAAFVLNLCIAWVLKETSAVGFNVTGIVKDVALVFIAAMFFQAPVTGRQAHCFIITLSGVFFWCLMKTSPDHWAVQTLDKALHCGIHKPSPLSSENDPLLEKPKTSTAA